MKFANYPLVETKLGFGDLTEIVALWVLGKQVQTVYKAKLHLLRPPLLWLNSDTLVHHHFPHQKDMACKVGAFLLVTTVAFLHETRVSANIADVANLVNDNGEAELPMTSRQVDNPLREYLSRVGGSGLQLPSGTRDIDRVREDILAGKWESFTAPPILEPDCHVEIVQRMPGRCINLGRLRTPACQSQYGLSLNAAECT